MKFELRKDFREIFLGNTALLDVRAPVEFKKGAFPNAVNMPLLNDQEREQVGITYKQQGGEAAVQLGHQLVHGNIKEQRIAEWLAFTRRHPEGLLYCFRGGQRSQIVQRWLTDAGVHIPRIEGGYKAMRQFLIHQIDALTISQKLILVGGRTGTGKTEVVNAAENSLDLEALAHHRGSAFGRRAEEQPTPINFENQLAIEWMKLEEQGARGLVLEDEGRTIGRCALPQSLWDAFQRSPIVLLEDTLERRVERIRRDYIESNLQEFLQLDAERGFRNFSDHLLASLDRIHNRLGGKAHAEVRKTMQDALGRQRQGDNLGHNAWIQRLLKDYYDPMYDYQLESKQDRITFRGDSAAVLGYLKQLGVPK
ncbi:MAG: tRNA 2-selenouridine(34) synthase MnmH [Xanthomonadales bacterium]|nr:tRNA 2-selenouridine(34) synthase MnmH [Xanthomonadales bacterium]